MRTSLLLFAIGAAFSYLPLAESRAADLNDVKRSLDALREQSHFKRMRVEKITRFPKGSLNSQRTIPSSKDFPPNDVMVTTTQEVISDLTNNRKWTKGEIATSRVVKDAQGVETVLIFKEYLESGFDGTTTTSLIPKDRQDPRVLPKDNLIPAEFRITRVKNSIVSPLGFPFYMSEGALPAPQQKGICPAECVLRPLIAWLGSNFGFGFNPEVRDGRSNGAECGEGAVLA